MLKQYIRREKNKTQKRVGVLVAEKMEHDGFRVGWSLCRRGKNPDKFNDELGMKIATGRLNKVFDPDEVPHSIKVEVMDFLERCKRYFK